MALFFLLCVSAVYPVVVAGNEDESNLLTRILPFQGVVGMLAAVTGLVLLVGSGNLAILSYVVVIIQIVLGGVMAYVWISTVFADGDEVIANPIGEIMAPVAIIGIALTALWIAQVTSA